MKASAKRIDMTSGPIIRKALLFALPMLERDSEIEITGKLESAPYIDMTIAAQKEFSIV